MEEDFAVMLARSLERGDMIDHVTNPLFSLFSVRESSTRDKDRYSAAMSIAANGSCSVHSAIVFSNY